MPSLKDVAEDTLRILDRGSYFASREVAIRDDVARSVAGTRLYRPAQVDALADRFVVDHAHDTRIEVTSETTAAATRRFAHCACLNFASAKHPGGGWLGGARAQEEDIARKSALYATLATPEAQPYYDENRASSSAIYTDHLVWSPQVPFFRDEDLALVDEPWRASIITSPAPNLGAMLQRDPHATPAVEAALKKRAAHVLAVFAIEGAVDVVLGAWGCGVFRNDPAFVAQVFADLLDGKFRGAFATVVFAIYGNRANQRAFEERFA
jgi:uncharacterized protein (TIGR02452 family)